MEKFKAELFDANRYELGESPFYEPNLNRYSWVDIIKGELWTLQNGEKKCFSLGQPIGAAIPIAGSEGFYLAAKDGIYIYENGNVKLLCSLTEVFKPYWRSNDAKTDPHGRIFFGASVADDDHEAEGALFCYDNGKITCLQENTKIANGMAWSSDEKYFYFADSLEHGVFRYDYNPEDGSIANRTMLFTVENGVPDGMCIDEDDNLWLAVWGGNRIEKHDGTTGELLAIVEVDAKQTSSCFFTDDGKKLLITSAGVGLDGESEGRLFVCAVK